LVVRNGGGGQLIPNPNNGCVDYQGYCLSEFARYGAISGKTGEPHKLVLHGRTEIKEVHDGRICSTWYERIDTDNDDIVSDGSVPVPSLYEL
jgi:hypothetical protein